MFINETKKILQKKQKRQKKRKRSSIYLQQYDLFRKKTTNRNWGSFLSSGASVTKYWRHYWTLMIKKKYKIRLNRKYRKKYKIKRGRGFGDGFKLLYSLGSHGVSQCDEVKKKQKNYAMVKLNVPKRVTLPNGGTFVARYKGIPRGELLPNIVMRRTYTQRVAPRGKRRRRAQQGQGIFDFVKKVARNPLVRSIARKGLEYAPGAYQNLPKRVKSKT